MPGWQERGAPRQGGERGAGGPVVLLADLVSPGAALELIRPQAPTDEPHPVPRAVPPGKSTHPFTRDPKGTAPARTRGGGGGQLYLLSLTLDAEYKEYRGQGKRAAPEETFKISPFRLRGKAAKFGSLGCLATHFEKGEAAGLAASWGNATVWRLPRRALSGTSPTSGTAAHTMMSLGSQLTARACGREWTPRHQMSPTSLGLHEPPGEIAFSKATV